MAPVYFQWGMSSFFGWGVYGLNLMRYWPKPAAGEAGAICASPFDRAAVALPDTDLVDLYPSLAASLAFQLRLAEGGAGVDRVDAPVLHSLSNGLQSGPAALGVDLRGSPDIGVIFAERTDFDADARERARRYAVFVAGSRWQAEVLERAGIGPVETVIQGIDTQRFSAAPRTARYGDRFVVFSGGKLEYRKAQDLVLEAFRAFAASRPDALLLAAWHSPWPDVAASVDSPRRLLPLVFDQAGQPDIIAWAMRNGIRAEQVIDLGAVPNHQMPDLLHAADIALFPNRCEAGTNLVAMEAMACGVPSILSANTGHLDLIGEQDCLPLSLQLPLGLPGCDGWAESSIDEIVDYLEWAYDHREEAAKLGAAGARSMARFAWPDQIAALARVVETYR